MSADLRLIRTNLEGLSGKGRRTDGIVPHVGFDGFTVLERAAIERALQETRHNKSHAAKMLGLTRKQLYVRLRQHDLN